MPRLAPFAGGTKFATQILPLLNLKVMSIRKEEILFSLPGFELWSIGTESQCATNELRRRLTYATKKQHQLND